MRTFLPVVGIGLLKLFYKKVINVRLIQLDSMSDAAQYVYANVAKYLFWGVV